MPNVRLVHFSYSSGIFRGWTITLLAPSKFKFAPKLRREGLSVNCLLIQYKREMQSATLAAGPGPEASENLVGPVKN